MIKEELVEIIAATHGIPKIQAHDIVRTLFWTVASAVVRGERAVLIGFGTFVAVQTGSRMGQNPRTGRKVDIAAIRRPKFIAGRAFRNAVRDGRTGSGDLSIGPREATPGSTGSAAASTPVRPTPARRASGQREPSCIADCDATPPMLR